ncbi:MAG: AAA family ATPase [bacterium]
MREELVRYGEKDPEVHRHISKDYISLKIKTSFMEISLRKNNVRILAKGKALNSELKSGTIPAETTRENEWGGKDTYFNIYSEEQVDQAKAIIDAAIFYEKHNAILPEKLHQSFYEEDIKDKNMLNIPLNQILYGPPGTGKTYKTALEALKIVMPKSKYEALDKKNRKAIMAEYNKYKDNGQIKFITFHQSYAYEEFVEGIKPLLDEDCQELKYEKKEGILRELARFANSEYIEINRNIDFDEKNNKVFKISLGDSTKEEDNQIYEYCLENNKIALGWGENLDFSQTQKKDDVLSVFNSNKDKLVEQSPYTVQAISIFKFGIKKGSLIFVSKGNKYVRAIGRVLDDNYIFDPDTEIRYCQFRNVEWLLKDVEIPIEKLYRKKLSQQSIYEFYTDKLIFENINELIGKTHNKQLKNYVLIIDEINRGNISKIFGELITLLEEDKRLYQENALTLNLPYSENDKDFGLPPNLYFIGTMNTSDRSIAAIDIALRRRFEFIELMPDSSLIIQEIKYNDTVINFKDVFETINNKIIILLDRDHQIGHSYFIKDKFDNKSVEEQLILLKTAWFDRIIPLLNEYFYGEWDKLEAILGKFIVKRSIPESLKGLYDEDYSFNFVSKSSIDNDEFISRLSELNDSNYKPLKAYEEK